MCYVSSFKIWWNIFLSLATYHSFKNINILLFHSGYSFLAKSSANSNKPDSKHLSSVPSSNYIRQLTIKRYNVQLTALSLIESDIVCNPENCNSTYLRNAQCKCASKMFVKFCFFTLFAISFVRFFFFLYYFIMNIREWAYLIFPPPIFSITTALCWAERKWWPRVTQLVSCLRWI